MKISYDKLWKLLIDKKMKKYQLREKASISSNSVAKLGKDEFVSMEVLMKICSALDCNVIEERAPEIDERKEFGHWESDLVIGSKSNEDEALLTMIERKTREFWMITICGKTPEAVMNALKWIHSQYSEHWDDIFKTITTDNGSEFARLSELESLSKPLVYMSPRKAMLSNCVRRSSGRSSKAT